MKYFNLLLALLLGFTLMSTLRADGDDDDNDDHYDGNDDDEDDDSGDDDDDDDRLFWLFRPRPTVRPLIPIRVQQRCPLGSQCLVTGCNRRSDCFSREVCCTSRNNRNVRCCVSNVRPGSVSTTTTTPVTSTTAAPTSPTTETTTVTTSTTLTSDTSTTATTAPAVG